jgi:threonine aldolase
MPEPPVDLRSDTVTRPTPEMRRAMADAEVGDDAYGEDPTVRRLEEEFAAIVGKQASVFVPSGTMGNQLALRLLARPGTLVLAGRRSHVVAHESGAGPLNAGIQLQPLDDDGGRIAQHDVDWAVEAARHHWPEPSLLCLENTYMPANGAPSTPDDLPRTTLPVHLDGARLWNAHVATGLPMATLAASATTVMCCLSKGLCAPVGSVLAGPADLMAEARVQRQRLGGGMRQAGILAAAGLVAMATMVDRLADDHRRAGRLAEAVGQRFDLRDEVRTNVVVFPASDDVIAHLGRRGVLAGTIAPGVVRLMTHHDVDDAAIDRALRALESYAGR